MSQQIDDRIVSMHFDNAEFEKNVSTSMGTIKKLTSALDSLEGHGSGEIFSSMSAAADSIDLSGAIAAANAVREGFSTMEIAGIAVITRLTNAFMNFGQRLWNISFGQMKSGGMTRALNIEQAEFMLKGMKQDVKQIKEDAMYAVEDTAYGFDEAAKAAASFGTAGVKAGDEMKKALLGVSGVAAMTNRSYSEIADIYTKIAATGKLTSIYVDSFNVRGLNVLDALSKKLNVTQAQVKEMVTKGKIDFKTFAEAMEEAFGAHAKDADNTFQGAISNVKAALSRIGADFATPIITDVVPVFHELKSTINDIRKVMQPTVKDFQVFTRMLQVISVNFLQAFRQTALPNVLDGLRYGFIALAKILFTVIDAIKEVFPNTKNLSGVFRSIMLSLIPSNEALAGFKEIVKTLLIVLRVVIILLGKFAEIVASVSLLIFRFAGGLMKVAVGLKDTIDPIIEFINKTNILDKLIIAIAQGIYTVGIFLAGFKNNMDQLANNEKVIYFIDAFKQKLVALSEGLKTAASNINWTSVTTIAFILSMVFVIEFLRQKLFFAWRGFVDTFGLLWNAAKSFGQMFTNAVGVLKSLRTTLDRMKFGIMADVILKFALSVGILALSLGYLASIPSNDLIKAGIALAFVGGALAILLMYLNKIISEADVSISASAKVFGLSAMFIALSIAFATMAAVIKVFSKMSVDELLKGVITLYAIAGLLVAISHLAGTAKLSGIVSLSIATLLLSKAISNLKGMDSSNIASATRAMMGMVVVAGLALLLATLIPLSLKFLDFIAFGAMIVALSYAMTVLATIPENDLNKAINAMKALTDIIKKLIWASLLAFALKPKGFTSLSVLLATLVGSLYVFKYIDQSEIDRGLTALNSLTKMILFMQFCSGLCLTMKPFGFIIFGTVLAILSGTMGYLSKLDAAGLKRAVYAITFLSILITLLVRIATEINTEGLNTKPFTNFALILGILSIALKSIAKIQDPTVLENSVYAMYALGALVVAMAKIAQWLGINEMDGSVFMHLGVAVIALSFAVNLLASALKSADDIMDMYLAVVAVGILTGELVYIMSRLDKETLPLATKGLVMLAAGVLVLSGAVAILTLLPTEKAMLAVTMVSVLAIAIATANNQLKAGYENANGFAIMAASLGALSLIIAYLAQLDIASILASALAIGTLAIELAIASHLLSSSGLDLKTAGSFAIMAVGLTVLAGGVSLLAQCDWAGVGVAILALTLVTAAMVGLAAIVGKFTFIAGGLMVISVVLLSLGVTALTIAVSIKMVADAFDQFTNTMIRWGETSSETIDMAINNMNRFILGLESVALSIAKTAPTWSNALSIVGMQIAAVVGSITISVAAYGGLGVLLFCKSILTQLPEILEVLATAMEAMGTFFENNKERVYDFGFQIGKVLFDGIIGGLTGIGAAIWDKLYGDTMKEESRKAAEGVAQAVSNVMVKNMDMYLAGQITAEQMVAGLKQGLENGMYSVEDVNRELAARGLEAYRDELGIHSPAREYIESSEFTIAGLIKGIQDGTYSFEDVMSDLAEAGVDAFTSKFNSQNLLSGVTGMMNLSSISNKDYLAIANTWDAEAEKYAWQLSGYQSAQAMANEMEARNKTSEWNSMLEQALAGLGLSMDDLTPKMEDYEIATDGASSALEDMSSATGSATNQTDKLKDSIKDALSVFEQFNEEASLTGREVLYNFMTEIRGVNTWSQELQALATKGFNANFLQELADQGPAAYEQIHALYTMTEEELTLFNQMYAHKIVLERGTAKTIRDSFVKNGAMAVSAAEKFGEDIADGTAKKVAESGEKISESEKKALEEAEEELEKKRIDEEFVEKWAQTAESSSAQMTLSNAFTKLAYTSMEALQKSVNFEVIMDKLILFKKDIKDQLKGSLNLFDEVTEVEEKDKLKAKDLLNNMEENLKRVGGWGYNLRKMISMGFSEGLVEELRQAGPESADKVEAFVKMTADEMALANKYYAESISLPDAVADRLVSAYADAGFTISLGLKKGLEDGKDDLLLQAEETGIGVSEGYVKGIDPEAANDIMHQLGSKSLSALKDELDSHSPSRKAEEIGQDFVDGFTLEREGQLDIALKKITVTMYTMGETAIKALERYLSGSKTMQIAKSFLEGFNNGINKYSSIVGSSIAKVGASIVDTFKDALGVHSPSIIAEEIMSNFLEGAMIPLANDTAVADAAKEQATTIAEMFGEGMDEHLFEDNVYAPVIRPIWDDTNISNGLIGLNNNLGGLNLSGTINGANASRSGPSQDAIMITNAINNLAADQRAIRNEIANLRSDTASLGNRIDGMYVRLDGNTLVGELVAPLDRVMGKKVITQKRGRV